jgi:hypothetical protein
VSITITDLEVVDYDNAEQAIVDWSILEDAKVADIAASVAWRFADDYPNLFEQEDAHQEVRLILAERATTARQVLADGTGLLFRWLTQRMSNKFLTTEKRLSGMVAIDELENVALGRPGLRTEYPAYDLREPVDEKADEPEPERPVQWEPQPKKAVTARYDRAIVEAMLPYAWGDSAAWGMKQDTAPDPDMPRGSKDPSKGWTSFAHVIDVRSGLERAGLTLIEKQSLLLRYGLDYSYEEAGALRGVQKSGAQRATERGVGKLTAHLNGDKYIDGYDQLEDEQSE